VFFLHASGPEFSVTGELYAEQLRKHLLVNIYKDGEWGTIARNIVDNSDFDHALDNNSTTLVNNIT